MPIPWSIYFGGWLPLERLLVVGIGGYFFLLFVMRTVGPRTMAKTNVFDFIILVSIGSVFGRILTAKDVSLAEALVAYALMIGLHYAVSQLRVHSRTVARWLDADPVLLYFGGEYVHRALVRARLLERDIEAAVRGRGFGSIREIDAIVLEPDGEISILPKRQESRELIETL